MQLTFKTIIIDDKDSWCRSQYTKVQTLDMSLFSGPFEIVDDFDRMEASWDKPLQHNTIGLIIDAKEEVHEGLEHWAGLSIRIRGRHRTIHPEDEWLTVKYVYLNEDGTLMSIHIENDPPLSTFFIPVKQ